MDLEVLLRQVSKDLPLFLYGHALGGLLIITLIIRNPSLKTAGDINININININRNYYYFTHIEYSIGSKHKWIKILVD
jgi:alpha-beta hydrolase superfamily lysophospholipase